MKRTLLVVGLLVCAVAIIGVASATAYSPPPTKQGPSFNPGPSANPYAYGGKITALRPPVNLSQWAAPAGPADARKLPAPKPPLALPTFGTDINISGGNETFIAANPANPL